MDQNREIGGTIRYAWLAACVVAWIASFGWTGRALQPLHDAYRRLTGAVTEALGAALPAPGAVTLALLLFAPFAVAGLVGRLREGRRAEWSDAAFAALGVGLLFAAGVANMRELAKSVIVPVLWALPAFAAAGIANRLRRSEKADPVVLWLAGAAVLAGSMLWVVNAGGATGSERPAAWAVIAAGLLVFSPMLNPARARDFAAAGGLALLLAYAFAR